MMKKIKTGLLGAVLLCMLTLTSCTDAEKTEVVSEKVVQIYDYGVPAAEIHNNATNVAIQYVNYIRAGHTKAAFDLVYKPAGTFYSETDMLQVEAGAQSLTDTYILYDVGASNNEVELHYGAKIGEAYTIAKKNQESTYIGEVIKGTKTINVPIVQENGLYYIDVHKEYMTTEKYALCVPDDVEVWFGDVMLDKNSRDDEGCYILTEFLATDYVTLTLKSAIETREIVLILNPDSASVQTLSEAEQTLLYPNTAMYKGVKRWDYLWEVSRSTTDDALQYVNTALQTIFDAAVAQEEFYAATNMQSVFYDADAGERVKPDYIKLKNAYVDSKTRDYKDLMCLDVNLAASDYMTRKQLYNCVNNNNEMQLYVVVDYSYLVVSSVTEMVTPYTGTVQGYVYLAKDVDGNWRVKNIDTKLLKAVR